MARERRLDQTLDHQGGDRRGDNSKDGDDDDASDEKRDSCSNHPTQKFDDHGVAEEKMLSLAPRDLRFLRKEPKERSYAERCGQTNMCLAIRASTY